MDDVSAGTSTVESHLIELRKVLQRVSNSGMKLKLPKCHFGTHSVEILGHLISEEGISPPKSHLSSIANLREPSDGHSVLRFLGLANYFSDFIENFAHRAKPLYDVSNGIKVNKKKLKYQTIDVSFFADRLGKEQKRAWEDIL